MEGRLSKHSLTSQDRPRDLCSYFNSPIVVLVSFSYQRHQQAGIGNRVHPREKPLREETSGGPPLIMPAYFFHTGSLFSSFSFERVASRDRRTSRPAGNPVMRDFSRRRSSSSSGRRIVSVLLIVHYCNTPELSVLRAAHVALSMQML